MRNGNTTIHGVTAADLRGVRITSLIDDEAVVLSLGEPAAGLTLFFDTPANFTAWADRLFELAHAVPEIAAAWSTYPVQS